MIPMKCRQATKYQFKKSLHKLTAKLKYFEAEGIPTDATRLSQQALLKRRDRWH